MTLAAQPTARRPFDRFVACHECDQVNRVRNILGSGSGKCSRCGATLYRATPDSIGKSLWLNLAAAMLFVLANTYPILTFKLEGREQVASMITGVFELYDQGFAELAVLVLLLSIVFPFARLAGALYVLVPLHFGRTPWRLAPIFRYYQRLSPWAMTEVYLLGLIVAYVKLSDIATLVLGIALYAFVAFTIVATWASASLDPREVWSRVPRVRKASDRERQGIDSAAAGAPPEHVSCHDCNLMVDARSVPHGRGIVARCPRCGGLLHRRKTNSVSTAWALLIAAVICYLPANVLPIMTVISFGEGEPDTILSGVKKLIEVKMYPVAILVFFASIFVPILKVLILSALLISVQKRSQWRPRQRTVLYRITEFIGRWSMVDIFMISILAALVKLSSLATIEPGAGAVFFAAVVILTMFSAMAFDPRLIWDGMKHGERTHA